MAKTTGQTAGAIGGAIIGGYLGGPQGALIGASLGMAGGGLIDPPDNSSGAMPPMAAYPVQRSNKGTPIPKTYGTVRVAGNIIGMGPNMPWQTSKSQSSGGKGGGGGSTVITGSGNRRSFLIGICEGTANIGRIWRNKEEITLDGITIFPGDGSLITGIEALIGEEYANYPNTTCAYFHEYEIGPTATVPNFTFETSNATISYINSFYAGGPELQILDQDLDFIQEIAVTQDGAKSICVDTSKNVYYNQLLNTGEPGDSTRAGIVKLGTDLIPDRDFFVASTPWAVGVWQGRGLRISPDGLHIWSTHNTAGTATWMRKYRMSDGVEDPVGPQSIIGWLNLCTAESFGIDQRIDPLTGVFDYRVYVPAAAWSAAGGGKADVKCNVYDKDMNFLHAINTSTASHGVIVNTEWNKIFVCGRATANETFSICTRSLDTISSQTVGVPSIDLETWLADGDAFYDTGEIIMAMIKVGDYIYACGTNPGSVSVWKFDQDLNLIASANTGNHCDGIWVDSRGRIIVKGYYDSLPSNFDKNIYIYDEDLNLLETVPFPEMAGQPGTNEGIISPRILADTVEAGDENPAIIIKDLLTNTRYGAGLDEDTKIDLASFQAVEGYCYENELLYSFSFDRMRPVVDWINIVLTHFNGFIRMSEGKIQLHVYKEETPAFEITRDNLIIEDDEDNDPPVTVNKRPTSDITNRVEVAWTDRDSVYDSSIVIAMDESDQRASGKTKKRTVQLPGIMNAALAQKMAQRVLFESMYRFSTYTFKVGYKDMRLEVGDVGTITDGFMLTDEVIRITSIEEIKDGQELQITAVQDSPFIYAEFEFATQDNGRVSDPTPTLVDGSLTITELIREQALVLSIAPGGEDTNGWQVYKSFDDETYELVGSIGIDDVAASPTNVAGTITSNLPAHKTGPVYAGQESMLVSIGTITALDTAVTDDQFFNGKRLCKIGNEIIAYHTCEQTEVDGIWRITGLIRGLLTTEAVAHVSGETFATINADFTFVFGGPDIGSAIYFKVLTVFGNSVQNLADVTGTPYTIQGKSQKPMPLSLLRIRGREGLETYEADDPIIDFYFCSKTAGFNVGGFGDILWGSYIEDPSIIQFEVTIREEDETEISDVVYDLSSFGDPKYYQLIEAEREGNNPVRVGLSALSSLSSLGERSILMEKV
jgi:hypothetical protein